MAMDRPQVTAHLCMMPACRGSLISAEPFPAPEPQPVAPLPAWLDTRSRVMGIVL